MAQLSFVGASGGAASELNGVLLITPTTTTAYLTITAALADAVAGNVVMVGPGTYAESVVVPAEVTLEGIGGAARVVISGDGVTSTVTMNDESELIDLTVYAPDNGALSGIVKSVAGRAIVMGIEIFGQGANAIGTNHSAGGFRATDVTFVGEFDAGWVQSGGASLLRAFNLRLITGIVDLIRHTGGNLAVDSIVVAFGVTITTTINAGAPGTVLDVSNSLIRSGTNGIRMSNDTAEVHARSVNIDPAVTTHILIDPGLTAPIIRFEGEASSQRITADGAWWAANTSVMAFRDENPETDTSFVVKGELHVGSPQAGQEAAIGEGEAYTQGMVVLTTDDTTSGVADGGNLTDVSAEAASSSGSTFTLQGLGVGFSFLVCTTLEDATGPIQHFGHRIVQTIARAGGSMVAEIWDGAAWVTIGVSNTLKDSPHTPLGCQEQLFLQLATQVRLGFVSNDMLGIPGSAYVLSTWATKLINGTTGYWMRYRVTGLLTTAPVFESLRLHGSRLEINATGFTEAYGLARRVTQLEVHQRLADDLSGASPGNVAIELGTGLAITPVDNLFTAAGTDGFGMVIEIPYDIDVGFPLMLRLGWRPSSTNTGNVRWETEFRIFAEGDVMDNAQALDGTITESQAAPGVTDQLMFYEVLLDLATAVPGQTYIGLGIQRLGADGADTFTGNVEVVFFQGFGVAWLAVG
jgi:hypothetical protein